MSSLKLPVAGQDIRLLVAVEPGSEPEAGMRLVVRGAPQGARMSHGKLADKDHWVIERIDIPELDITLPAKAAGPIELHLDLNSKDGRLLASKSVAFVVEPAAGTATPALTADASKPATAAVAVIRARRERLPPCREHPQGAHCRRALSPNTATQSGGDDHGAP